MGKLGEVWGQVKSLIADGISIIPVRDKNETTKTGEVYAAKTPYKSWKEFQNRQVTEQELWMLMEEKDTTAIAIICGKVSGNIEVIDIDVKYKAGIDAILMADIQKFYPDLFDRLRIHKTPSGGYHIVYRVTGGEVPGNLKLAGRPCTEEEIQAQKSRGVKRPNKEANFLETRGEGGYILAPPSIGYAIHKDGPIPQITWEERCSLITLCQTYNEIIKVAPQPKPTKSQESIYDENPFEHFNRVKDPTELMTELGWKYSHDNNRFIWYTRPGKGKGVSISWNKVKNIFYVFTSSTELQSERGYNPATILAELKFDGDKSKTYFWLTQNGYGKVKKKVEQGIIKKAAISGGNIPANFSDDAKQTFENLKITIQEDHPFGIFWEQDDEGKVTISRESVYQVSKGLGFRLHKGGIYRIEEKFIHEISERQWMDELKNYIREEDADLYEDICNSYESFMQKSAKFTIQRLEELEVTRIIRDTRSRCYKFYLNGYLEITADSCTLYRYEALDGLVFYSKVQQREYREGSGGRFVEYLNFALVNPTSAKPVLGYLAHDYKDETTGFIVVLTESCQDPKQGGGSGKNVLCNLLKLTTTYVSRAGSQSRFDDKFFQIWNGQRVFGISDLPKNFDFSNFKEPATGSFSVKKLYKDETTVEVEDAPKFIMQTNYSYTDSDGGLLRRIIPLEFTDFFTRCGGIDVHFGVHFPNGWTQEDYAGFDNYIAEAIQIWISGGLKLKPVELTDDGWLKKFELNYGKTAAGFVIEKFMDIIGGGKIANKTLRDMLATYHSENRINSRYEAAYETIGKALKVYCERMGIDVKTGHSVRIDALTKGDGRKFEALTDDGARLLHEAGSHDDIPF